MYASATPSKRKEMFVLDPFYDVNNKVSLHVNSVSTIHLEPKINKLVVFDANCSHYVNKNLSSEPRVSISFNAFINA